MQNRLSDIDINSYKFEAYSLNSNNLINKILFKKDIPSASINEKLSRLFQITKTVYKHKIGKEPLTSIKFRQLLEDLGPTFIKIGQILSKRTDLLPISYCKELEKLCSSVTVIDFNIIKQIIKEELGSLDIFENIEVIPVGSASIAQVHKATLKNGEKVIIKVQRPMVYDTMRQDIMLFNSVIKPLKIITTIDGVDLYSLLNDLWLITQQELNFFNEAINTIKFGEVIKKYDGIICPKIYKEYTTSKIITMEYINGINILDSDVNKKELGNKLAQNFIYQALDEQFFHADPHQGNILIKYKENGYNIVWIDFGMVYSLNKSIQSSLKQMILAVVQKDINLLISNLLMVVTIEREIDYSRLYIDLDYLLLKYASINLEDIDISMMFDDTIRVIRENGLKLNSNVNILIRALISLEGLLQTLDNKLNIMDVLKDYIINNIYNKEYIKQIIKDNEQTALKSIQKGIELPALYNDLLSHVLRGQLKFNVYGTESQINRLKRTCNLLFICLTLCAIMLSTSIILAFKVEPLVFGMPVFGIIGIIGIIILSLILFIRLLKNK